MQGGVSPLYIASEHGHDQVVTVLLDNGAKVDKPSEVCYFTCIKARV